MSEQKSVLPNLMPRQSPPIIHAVTLRRRPNLIELAKQPGIRFVWDFRKPCGATFSVDVSPDQTVGRQP